MYLLCWDSDNARIVCIHKTKGTTVAVFTYMGKIDMTPLIDHGVNTFRHDKINDYFQTTLSNSISENHFVFNDLTLKGGKPSLEPTMT